jgi:hypothetical protein
MIVSRPYLLPLLILTLGGCVGALPSQWTLPNQTTPASTPRDQNALPRRHTLISGHLVVHSDFLLGDYKLFFEELTALEIEIQQQLELTDCERPIHVYLFENEERFQRFVRAHHPEFPARRAFFWEDGSRLSVYARQGDRMTEDLRHEVTHGYLHAMAPNLPLWLDEGLAKYYEVVGGQRRVNRPLFDVMLAQIRSENWRPDLPRLEQFSPTQDMSQSDYAEAWAWTHFLLESRPEHARLLRDYLASLQCNRLTDPISVRIAAVAEHPQAALIEHLEGLTALRQ